MDTDKERLVMDRRTDRAADFAARAYSGSATPDDVQELERWMSEDPENREEYKQVLETWDFMDELCDHLDKLEVEKPEATPSVLDHKPVRKWPKLAAAAGFMLAASIVILTLYSSNTPEKIEQLASYTTRTGEQKTVELDDGSTMVLNTNSRVLVDYSTSVRKTIIDRGEVFFEVVKDPLRPFVVDTGARSITVLGTSFDVLKAGMDLEVSVVEGLVAVHRSEKLVTLDSAAVDLNTHSLTDIAADSDSFRLSAGIKARFTGTFASDLAGIEVSELSEIENFPSWRYGSIRFNDRPLYEVVRELNRYTRRKVLIEDSRVMDLKVNVVFQLDEVESVLHKMEGVLPLRVTRYPDRIVIVGR